MSGMLSCIGSVWSNLQIFTFANFQVCLLKLCAVWKCWFFAGISVGGILSVKCISFNEIGVINSKIFYTNWIFKMYENPPVAIKVLLSNSCMHRNSHAQPNINNLCHNLVVCRIFSIMCKTNARLFPGISINYEIIFCSQTKA